MKSSIFVSLSCFSARSVARHASALGLGAIIALGAACGAPPNDDRSTEGTSASSLSTSAVPAASGLPPECAAIRATLTADRDHVDRTTASLREASVVLGWNIELPPTCDVDVAPRLGGVRLDDPRMRASGTHAFVVEHTTTFALVVRGRTLASHTVQVTGDPGIVTIDLAAGNQVTAADIAAFDAKYMQPYQRERAVLETRYRLFHRLDSAMWEAFEWIHAMVRMYDLTHERRYVEHLGALLKEILPYRDDHHPGRHSDFAESVLPPALDVLRASPSPLSGWGGAGTPTAGLHTVGYASFVYMYGLSAFARIVMETPSLHASFGRDAIDDTNAALATDAIFAPTVAARSTFPVEARALKETFARVPTNAECDAYRDALEAREPPSDADRARNDTQNLACKRIDELAGSGVPYNYQFLYVMASIELWNALRSSYYLGSGQVDPRAALARTALPIRVSRMTRYFMNRLRLADGLYVWNYGDEVPSSIGTHTEDASHGGVDMMGLEVVRANRIVLDAVATPLGAPLPGLGADVMARFAKSFTSRLGAGSHLADDLDGDAASPVNKRDGPATGGSPSPRAIVACTTSATRSRSVSRATHNRTSASRPTPRSS